LIRCITTQGYHKSQRGNPKGLRKPLGFECMIAFCVNTVSRKSAKNVGLSKSYPTKMSFFAAYPSRYLPYSS
jgi:hypothetical protein